MMTSVNKTECNLSNLDTLQTTLQNQLKNKKVLLILDGLETEDHLFWDTIRVTLNSADKGTKMLVTSRNQIASQYIGMSDPILLNTLDTNSLWLVLMDEAFPQAYGYELLPLHLKRCFAYCSIFPKNYEFDRDDLVKLWVSEGLILSENTHANKVLEDIGRKQFTDLLKRSFFQSSDGSSTKYVMPGSIHDLAQSVSEYECLRVDHSEIQHGNRKHKHAIYALLVGFSTHSVNHIYERKYIRTFILYNESRIVAECIRLAQLVKELRCLRSLDLSYKNIKNLPSSIKNLIHLRYLNLRGSLFETLPESEVKEKDFNRDVLESLKPAETIKSIFIEGYNGSTFPDWIEDPLFSKLETIGLFKCKECTLQQLGKLRQLKCLYIQGFDKVEDLNDLIGGSNGSVGFQSLEKLYISDMPELKTCGVLEEMSTVINSTNCPKLVTRDSNNIVASPQSSTPSVGTTGSGIMHWIRKWCVFKIGLGGRLVGDRLTLAVYRHWPIKTGLPVFIIFPPFFG
ncbi:hypothetical protein LUZ60_004029 [Juncus effusus]|nr:hypothetical protein LUZ60_004029 [Juncus effusus]